MKKLLIVFLLLIGFFSFRVLPVLDLADISEKIKNDSGWDSSYDSGGGSSYSGGSSYDSDYSDGGGGSFLDFVFGVNVFFSFFVSAFMFEEVKHDKIRTFLIMVSIFVIIISQVICMSTLSEYIVFVYLVLLCIISYIFFLKESKKPTTESEIAEIKLKKYGLDKTILENELYSIFLEIQTAWMNFNYKKLQKLCTDELYNTYKAQLDVLSIKNGKNIMSDFTLNWIKIFEIKEENGLIVVKVYMNVSFYDYVIDCQTQKVTRGKIDVRLTNDYEMVFVKHKHRTVKHCPSCGAELNGQRTCPYCSSVVYNNNKGFVLSKKMIRR